MGCHTHNTTWQSADYDEYDVGCPKCMSSWFYIEEELNEQHENEAVPNA